jgi:hypothetical protein
MSRNNKEPEGVSFTGLSGALRESPWLASEDLMGLGDVQCEIEDVLLYKEVKFEAGRAENNVPALRFKGRSKKLVLNATNRRACVAMFGARTQDWRGKTVTIHVDMNCKQVGGGRGPGLRIKITQQS